MEFVPVLLVLMLFVDFLEIVLVVGAFGVDALVDAEAGTDLDRNEGVATVGALVLHRPGVDTVIDERGAADLAQVLTMAAVVVVEVVMRSTADRADLALGDRVLATSSDGLDLSAVTILVVLDQELPVLLEEMENDRQLVDLEPLILGGLGVIESPLPDGNEFTDVFQ